MKKWRGHLNQIHCLEENEPKILIFMGKCPFMRLPT